MGYSQQEIANAIKATAAVCGGDISDEVCVVMMADLKPYGGDAVMAMLQKLRRTHKGRFSLAQMIELIDGQDGRPGVETAWGIVSRILADESVTEFLTPEMEEAYFACASLYNDQGHIPARQAFKEVYTEALRQARDKGHKPTWKCSQGNNKVNADAAIRLALEQGKISKESALVYLPACADETRHLIETGKIMSLEHKQAAQQKIGAIMQNLKLGFKQGES